MWLEMRNIVLQREASGLRPIYRRYWSGRKSGAQAHAVQTLRESLRHSLPSRRLPSSFVFSMSSGTSSPRSACSMPMAGVLAVPDDLPIGQAIEDLSLLVECTTPGELQSLVLYLPL
jgi:hypothetical protein